MNNFNSVFEELSKLYEEKQVKNPAAKKAEQSQELDKKAAAVGDDSTKALTEETVEEVIATEVPTEETEPADDEEVEIEITEDEPRQLILECDNCGGLLIKSEPDVVVDEETDLANVEDACEYCEEVGGYKIVGVVAPYVAETSDQLEEAFGKPKELSWTEIQNKYDVKMVTAKELKKGDLINDSGFEPREFDANDYFMYIKKVEPQGGEFRIHFSSGAFTNLEPNDKCCLAVAKK